ncbi:MAG: response regulator [Calditrichae bacterium]|nr:response regulator [Calditrichota bacterium]MCB9058859.1 response regulator [Calditrichia bacterium]
MSEKYRVLLIEDDYEDYMLTKFLFNDAPHIRFELVWAESPETGIDFLSKENFHICLIDYNLGKIDGIDLLKKASGMKTDIPFIILTGLNNPELDNEAMKTGASDYLVKGTFDPEILERTIRHAIERKSQECELRKTHEELEKALNEIKENQKQLIEIENLKSVQQLAGAVAHEFSQPLQALLNYADLLKLSFPNINYTDAIKENVYKISKLTDNLRNLTNLTRKRYVDNQILDIEHNHNENVTRNHILVVDDEPSILETLVEMFKIKGYECDAASDGSEALKKTREKRYHFIVSDINMPVMDGTEFFKHFRKYDTDTPFIFITGYEVSEEIKQVVKKADALINKPVNFDKFFNMVQQITKNRN